MTHCDLFEREGLLQLERGIGLDPHFETCPDRLDARRQYARLTQTIGELDAAATPSPFWQTRVWAAIKSTPPRKRRWAWWLAPVGAVAALVVFMVWWFPASSPLPAVFLATEIRAGQTVVSRGQDAHPGDELRLRATVGASAFAELRVYFNDNELPVHCSTDPPCRRDGDSLSLVTTLKSLGTYRPVLIVSANPIPAPSGNLDQDAGAALRSGATVQAGDPIPVR